MDRLLQTAHSMRRQHLVRVFSLRLLLVVPVALAVATALVLFVHSDVNIAMLFSQCHARARLPWLSHMPLLGAPACFLVSFFGEAVASARARAAMGVVLSFVSGLLTVSTVESARICNGPSLLIACPTGPWLVFNLVGGAMVWELLIIPAFFRRSKQILSAQENASDAAPAGDPRDDQEDEEAGEQNDMSTSLLLAAAADPDTGSAMRHLAAGTEVVAIPVAVALGFVLPSLLMLLTGSPAAIVAWLFYPVYVSLIRQGVRLAVSRCQARRPLHLESHKPSLLAVYAVPIACSVLAHAVLLWNLTTRPDDGKEMTRSALVFIEIDFVFIGLTVLYWILVEAGWRVILVVLAFSVALGPGAGLCIGWVYRETQLGFVSDALSPSAGDDAEEGGGRGGGGAGEETPLLR